MKELSQVLKTGLWATAAGVGILAILNAWISAQTQPLQSLLPGEEKVYFWRGHRLFYKVTGSGQPLLLLHGIGAGSSSYEFRAILAELGQRYQVYALDLLGWGNSERPDLEYTGGLYAQMIQDFVEQVIRQPCHVIANSLSAGFVLRSARLSPQHWRKLLLIAPLGDNSLVPESVGIPLAQLAYGLLSLPVVGLALYNGITAPWSVRLFTEQSLFSPDYALEEAVVDYYYQAAHQAGANFAPRSFLTGKLNLPIQEDFRVVAKPMALVWGERNRLTTPEQADRYRALRPEVPMYRLPGAAFPHIEAPSAFLSVALNFLAETDPALPS
ncbi:MAG: alpha/beta fold hydrolase [Thermostichus sp. BF3_bins_97]